MAHRHERRAVRRGRHAARRGVRALPAAALLLSLLPGGAAAAEAGREALARSARVDAWSWWVAPGRGPWAPWTDRGAATPRAWAGLVAGATALDDPLRAPAEVPAPGLRQMHPPLAWTDSLSARAGGDAAWHGFDAAIASLAVRRDRAGGARARTVFGLVNGSFGHEDYALAVERGDTSRWLRLETATGRRGAAGALEDAGRHQWGIAGGGRRGPHGFEVAYAQRGEALRASGDAEQAGRGESGRLAWRIERGRARAGAAIERGWTRHESFGGPWAPSRREADATRGEIAAALAGDAHRLEARLAGGVADVARIGDGAFARSARWAWGAVRWSGRAGDGMLAATLGGGRHGGVDRTEWAPSLAYAFVARGLEGRLVFERALAPLWADLAPASSAPALAPQAPFLQDTWLAGLELASRAGDASATASFHLGRTRDRAIVARRPLEEEWLRIGARAERGPYDFGLLAVAGEWRGRHVRAGVEGMGLARDPSALQPAVDPPFAARAHVGWGFRAFEDDLAVEVRGEIEGVGERESESPPGRTIAGHATSGAVLSVALADARLALRVRNFEDRRREEVWADPATGAPARGPGREVTLTLLWRLFN